MIQLSTVKSSKQYTSILCLAHINVSALVLDRLCLMSVIICPATELTLSEEQFVALLKANHGASVCVCALASYSSRPTATRKMEL